MTDRRLKVFYTVSVCVVCLICSSAAYVAAANIAEFVKITPYIDIGVVSDDNIYEISDDVPLPPGQSHDDVYLDSRVGIGLDVTLERRLLKFKTGLDYEFGYKKYSDNTNLDDNDQYLNFDLSFGNQYEQGFFRDRATLILNDNLSFVPIDEELALLPGNRTLRNDFIAGIDYNIISKPRTAFILGYSYGRIDFGDDDIDVPTVSNEFQTSSDLTQESQTHTGKADLKHALNPKLTYVLGYNYQYTDREEQRGVPQSANFARQNLLTGVKAILTAKTHSTIEVGYSGTSYDSLGRIDQDDQSGFIANVSLTSNFDNRPQMTLGYRRYYNENDFGDTLLTDDVFAKLGFKVRPDLLLNVTADYILEDRDLFGDDNTQILFGVGSEYDVLKNTKLLAAYDYRDRDFFEEPFLETEARDKTTHRISGGVEYKVARYVLLRGMYYYTDNTSDSAAENYTRNQFVASGRVIFN